MTDVDVHPSTVPPAPPRRTPTTPPDAPRRRLLDRRRAALRTDARGRRAVPLYVVYQARWGFSSITLTAVFAAYVVALLLALVVVGALSDHIGRRPVLIGALLAEALAMVLFIVADGVPGLYAARAVQGLATGAATGAVGAALLDLQPAHRPGIGAVLNSVVPGLGLGAGALGAGLLVQYAPAPTTLVFVILAVVFVLGAAATAAIPETSARRPGALASLTPRVHVPPRARGAFLRAAPALAATWAIGGFYLSLGPSLAAGVLGLTSHLVGGLVVATLMLSGALASALLGGRPPRAVMATGSAVLAAGTGLTLAGVEAVSVPLFFLGTAVAGFGFGSGFLGAFRTVAAQAEPAERAGLFATVYVLNYLAFSVPAVAAGSAIGSEGLTDTTLVYGAVVIVLALAALGGLALRGGAAVEPRRAEG